MKQFILHLILMLCLFGACIPEGSDDISAYYFPIDQLEQGVVYEYRSTNGDSTLTFYYYLKSFVEKDQTTLRGAYYDSNLLLQHTFTEKKIKDGWILKQFDVVQYDSLYNKLYSEAEIIHDNIFPAFPKDTSSVTPYSVKWKNAEDAEVETNLMRYRIYKGAATLKFNGTEKDCVVFDVKERVELKQEGYIDFHSEGKEWYAKGEGLIYYRKKIGEHLLHEYSLHRTYSTEAFESSIGNVLDSIF